VKSIQQAAQRKQRKRDSKEILLITPKALEIVVIEVINKLNLKRSRKPTVLDERMFLAHVEPIPARLLAEHQMLRRGNAALVRRPVDLLASIIEPRYCTVEGGKITVGKLSYGSPSSVPEGDEGPAPCCNTVGPSPLAASTRKRPRSRSMSSPTRM
jgi:hypothetical protein